MAKFPTYEEMGKKIAEKALDGYIYKGKTLREWVDILAQTRWIPVKWHEITDEERKREGYPEEWLTMLDCLMPNDGEEILVTIKSSRGGLYVEKDVCYVDDGYSLDSGCDWIDDVAAWMPLPKPYKAENEVSE